MGKILLKATHEGELTVGATQLNVAVLENGTRIITQSAVFKAFGRTKRGRAKTDRRVLNRPAFVDARNLQPLINKDLDEVLNLIEFRGLNGKESEGYSAEILPLLCKLYLDAREDGVIVKSQLPLARASEILLVSLSKVGITALVDEATGYQFDREKDALQTILKAYISEELLPWQKRFPDEFYREIFRLNKWPFTVKQINTQQRPGVIGTWTKKYIYSVLPKGVLNALLKKTPRNDKGKLTKKLHQSLTREQGIEHLNRQIVSVVTLMNVSDTWGQFQRLWNKKFGQLELPFEEYSMFDPQKETPQSSFNNKLKQALNYNPKDKE